MMTGAAKSGRMISFYAAGVAVMFLLFSASSGGGALLDEQDSGTLERVLNSKREALEWVDQHRDEFSAEF